MDMHAGLKRVSFAVTRAFRLLVRALAGVACVGTILMMAGTVADILMRRLARRPIPGMVDLIQIAAAVTIACAMPYTTAVKGHVAVEFLFLRLPRLGRLVVDTGARLCGIALFAVLGTGCFRRGAQLMRAGEVTLTLELPLFWVFHVMGACCMVTALVILHHMVHPGREMIKP
ncbi:MAG: TRAP transporter small permease [Lentisphaeria bacterium]|nr:TRAP transporter small permease [Lentisphaeria bacterium]